MSNLRISAEDYAFIGLFLLGIVLLVAGLPRLAAVCGVLVAVIFARGFWRLFAAPKRRARRRQSETERGDAEDE